MNLHEIAARCDRVRWNGKHSFTACCLSHHDSNPSMSVREAEDGIILVHCFAGCPQDEVLRALAMMGNRGYRPPLNPAPPRPKTDKPTSNYAQQIWQNTMPDELISWDEQVSSHPYAVKKEIKHACGAARGHVSGRLLGKYADCIFIPMRTLRGEFTGVECINAGGVKQSFGSKGVLTLGNTLDKTLPIFVVEGWADGAAAWRYYGNVVVLVTFGKGRQESIARDLDKARPDRSIVIVRDSA